MDQGSPYGCALGLEGRGFVVLGAGGGGIGPAVVAALAGAGAEVLCVDADPGEAERAAADAGGHPHVADVTRRDEVEALFARAAALFGDRFKGVVDIVGVARTGPLPSFDDAALDRQFDLVLRHAVLALQVGAPLLAKTGGGSLTFVGSGSGERVVAGQAVYGAAKAALHHLVRYAAQEFGPSGVRVNAISPGVVGTPRLLAALPPAVWARLAADNPLRRTAEPADIGKAALFLASSLADYVTGNVLALDGGAFNAVTLPGLSAPLERQAQPGEPEPDA